MGADAGAFWGGVLIFLAVWALVQYSEQIRINILTTMYTPACQQHLLGTTDQTLISTFNPPDNIYLSIHTSKPNGLVTDFGIDRYYCDALKALNTRFYHKAIA